MFKLTSLAAGVSLVLAATTVFAQGSGPATPRVDARQAAQSARVDAGVASGSLTARETSRLERQQGRIAAAETHVKADGVVTARERRRLDRRQDRASASIAVQKHDGQGKAKP